MEPVVFMPTALAGHVAKHCNHMVSSPDENNNIGGVYCITLMHNVPLFAFLSIFKFPLCNLVEKFFI